MPTPGPVAKLCWGTVEFEINGQGCGETYQYLEPTATGTNTPIETLALIHRDFIDFRAAVLPKTVTIIEAKVGYYGAPPDSCDALWGYLYGLHSGAFTTGTYVFGTPNDIHGCLGYRATALGGASANRWIRFLDDVDVGGNQFQAYPAGIITKPAAAPSKPTTSSTKQQCIQAFAEAFLFYTVKAGLNPAWVAATKPTSILKYIYDDWRRLTFGNVKSRKIGAVAGAESGKKKAYT